MSQIPGLLLCPVEEESSEGSIKIEGFNSTVVVPESHRYGNCRKFTEFKVLELMGEGSFGWLLKAEDLVNRALITLKGFSMPSFPGHGLPICMLQEVTILKTLKHKNVIYSNGVAAGKSLGRFFLILEYCPVSLKDLIDWNIIALYEQPKIKSILQQLLQGLDYIHKSNAIHRDISSQNIVFSEMGVLKISGFSSVCYNKRGNWDSLNTEMRYRAPEVLLGYPNCGSGVDIWAAGCVFAELLLQKPVIKGNTEIEVLHSITDILGVPSEESMPGFNQFYSALRKRDRKNIQNENITQVCDLNKVFAQCLPCSFEIIENIFIFRPEERPPAEELLLICNYFQNAPTACSSEDFASLLKNKPVIKKEPPEKS